MRRSRQLENARSVKPLLERLMEVGEYAKRPEISVEPTNLLPEGCALLFNPRHCSVDDDGKVQFAPGTAVLLTNMS